MKHFIDGFAKFITAKAATSAAYMVKCMMLANALMYIYALYCDVALGKEKYWGMAVFAFIMSILLPYAHYTAPDRPGGFWFSNIASLILLANMFTPVFHTGMIQTIYTVYCVLVLYAAAAIPDDIGLAKRRANRGLLFTLFLCWCISFITIPIVDVLDVVRAMVGMRIQPLLSYVVIAGQFKLLEMRNSGEIQTEVKTKLHFFSIWLSIILTYLSIHVVFSWIGISFLYKGTQALPDKYAALTLVYFVYIGRALNKKQAMERQCL